MKIKKQQKTVTLTPDQMQAVHFLEKALEKCRRENVYLLDYYGQLIALNGYNVADVGPALSGMTDLQDGYVPLQNQYNVNMAGYDFCPMADDLLVVRFKD
jgi:hypothetical protein